MKKIVKIGACVAAMAAVALSLTGCSPKKCSVCGNEYTFGGKTETVMGHEVNVCGDCVNAANKIQDGVNNLFG